MVNFPVNCTTVSGALFKALRFSKDRLARLQVAYALGFIHCHRILLHAVALMT